jgi:hypothetical protein
VLGIQLVVALVSGRFWLFLFLLNWGWFFA